MVEISLSQPACHLQRLQAWILRADQIKLRDSMKDHTQLVAWPERSQHLAKLIPPHKSVLDVGAGSRELKLHLRKCWKYTSIDQPGVGEQDYYLDLNQTTLPDLDCWDYAVFAGVLEYLNDIKAVLSWAHKHAGFMLITYSPAELNPDPDPDWAHCLSITEFELELPGYPERLKNFQNQVVYRI